MQNIKDNIRDFNLSWISALLIVSFTILPLAVDTHFDTNISSVFADDDDHDDDHDDDRDDHDDDRDDHDNDRDDHDDDRDDHDDDRNYSTGSGITFSNHNDDDRDDHDNDRHDDNDRDDHDNDNHDDDRDDGHDNDDHDDHNNGTGINFNNGTNMNTAVNINNALLTATASARITTMNTGLDWNSLIQAQKDQIIAQEMAKLGYAQTGVTIGTTTANTVSFTTLTPDQENQLVAMGWSKPVTTTTTTTVDPQVQTLADAQALVDAAVAQAAADAATAQALVDAAVAQAQALLDATQATGTVTVVPIN
jgi:hypothetical protein